MSWLEYQLNKRIECENSIQDKFGDPKEYLLKRYVTEQKSLKYISNETGLSCTFITRFLDRLGIEKRGKSEARKGKPNPFTKEHIENIKKSHQKKSTKKKHSEANKRVWSKMSYEDKIKRTTPGNVARTRIAQSTLISSIEIKVKNELDKRGIRYSQQKPIRKGKYFLDFYLPDYRLIIECNGDYWHNLDHRKKRDKELKKYVEKQNIKIVFLWEHEINENVITLLDKVFKEVV